MLNPNINKYVLVKVLPVDTAKTTIQKAIYRGHEIEIMDYTVKALGNRRMFLRYSICSDRYYLKSK